MLSTRASVASPPVVLRDGSEVTIEPNGVEVRDVGGRLLIRYRDGVLQLDAEGDLTLNAGGQIRMQAQKGVHLDAGPELRVRTEQIDAEAKTTRLLAGVVSVFARDVTTTATRAMHRVERWELNAQRIVEHTRDVFREVEDLAQENVGRLRTVVRDVYSVTSRRTDMLSEDDTSIDGKRVLLG